VNNADSIILCRRLCQVDHIGSWTCGANVDSIICREHYRKLAKLKKNLMTRSNQHLSLELATTCEKMFKFREIIVGIVRALCLRIDYNGVLYILLDISPCSRSRRSRYYLFLFTSCSSFSLPLLLFLSLGDAIFVSLLTCSSSSPLAMPSSSPSCSSSSPLR
jgi:hypothetical protein